MYFGAYIDILRKENGEVIPKSFLKIGIGH